MLSGVLCLLADDGSGSFVGVGDCAGRVALSAAHRVVRLALIIVFLIGLASRLFLPGFGAGIRPFAAGPSDRIFSNNGIGILWDN